MTQDRGSRRSFLQRALRLSAGEESLSFEQVPKKELGSTGVKIPILLLGGGRGFDVPYDKRLHRALAVGANYIDTALHYANGKAHPSTAAFIKQVGREKLWLTSKFSYHGRHPTPEHFEKGLEKCLKTLEVNALDMFFMHALTLEECAIFDKPLQTMIDRIKKNGKTRFFGFSCHGERVPEIMQAAAQWGGGIDAIMFRYNFRQYGDKELNNAIDACKKAGIGLLAMKTQGSVPDDQEQVLEFQSKDFTLAQAKLKAVWADERIDAVCSHMANVAQVEENTAAAMNPKKLSMADFQQLNRLAAHTAPYACLGCGQHCQEQLDGPLRIADSLRYLMYDECYGEDAHARSCYAKLGNEEKDFSAYDLSASTAACPQGIRLKERLAYAHRRLKA